MEQDKLSALKQDLAHLGSLAVAFSAGVDSTFLLKVAHDVLGDRCIALTARSALFPGDETDASAAFCRREGIRQIMFDAASMDMPAFTANPPDRCYICKRAIFSRMLELAKENGMAALAEGSNTDDTGDYRPGMRAVAELGVLSPLKEAGLSKAEIRTLSRGMGLPTWNKPSFACLASRFVYGETITPERLQRVGAAERLLRDLGLSQYRVRIHGDLARIEVPAPDIPRIAGEDTRRRIHDGLRALGFAYVTLDLMGYRTGSMNETLTDRAGEPEKGPKQ